MIQTRFTQLSIKTNIVKALNARYSTSRQGLVCNRTDDKKHPMLMCTALLTWHNCWFPEEYETDIDIVKLLSIH